MTIKEFGQHTVVLMKNTSLGSVKNGAITGAGGLGLQLVGAAGAWPLAPAVATGAAGAAAVYAANHLISAFRSPAVATAGTQAGAPAGSLLGSPVGNVLGGVAASSLGSWLLTYFNLYPALPILPAVYATLAGYAIWLAASALINKMTASSTAGNTTADATVPTPEQNASAPTTSTPAGASSTPADLKPSTAS